MHPPSYAPDRSTVRPRSRTRLWKNRENRRRADRFGREKCCCLSNRALSRYGDSPGRRSARWVLR
ncbi:MAG: hypothetical protein KAX13_08780 [Candidatus Krumholzibacteria bacterium]|nr:hypothetical protein [Candidatus Krumholzibacteria bacterium]